MISGDFIQQGPHEECGVVAVHSPTPEASRIAYYGLFALQHRGQESAGIASWDGSSMHVRKDSGLVARVFSENDIAQLSGSLCIGHTRYSTTGSSNIRNVQPFLVDTRHGPIAIAHNGNIVNSGELRKKALERGAGLTSASDTELMVMSLAAAEAPDWTGRIRSAMADWIGAYSFVALTPDGIYAARDPWGFRPLCYGTTNEGAFVVASESCALSTLGCPGAIEIEPGQILRRSSSGEVTIENAVADRRGMPRRASCVFEFIYFSRPDSVFNGLSVHEVRRRLGIQLAKCAPAKADIVVPVPDSSISAAIGYSIESGIPYGEAFVKNRYIGRTFIEPTDALRKRGVSLKFNVLSQSVAGKRVVVIDDSIVRGNTVRPLVTLLKAAGASEVHVRVASPPVRHPCMMGVDMGEPENLVANRIPREELPGWSGADSLEYLTEYGLAAAVEQVGYCDACFTGRYPFDVAGFEGKNRFEF